MKRLITLIGLLLLLYLLLRLGYRFYGRGHNYEYNINNGDNNFTIIEKFNNDKDNPNYYFEVKIDDNTFYLQTYDNFKNKSKIIKNIYYYSNDIYKCILPIFVDDQIISDILCKRNDSEYLYYYNNLKGINNDLDEFANELLQYGYDSTKWYASNEKIQSDGVSLYYNNMFSNHYVLLTNYKGILLLNTKNKKVNKINLFSSDVYQKKLDFVYKNKYVVADYNMKFRFHEFYVIDMTNGDKSTIISNNELSFDSYIQGIVDSKVYLFDKDSKKQYAIDMKKNEIKEVGNEKLGVKIYNNTTMEWEVISDITASNKQILFSTKNNEEKNGFVKVDKIGTADYGYYFYYKKVDDKYLVYRSNVQDNTQLTYVFTTTNIVNIIYFYDSVYFINDEFINNYSDKFGVRKIASYNELKFNDNLYFSAYAK